MNDRIVRTARQTRRAVFFRLWSTMAMAAVPAGSVLAQSLGEAGPQAFIAVAIGQGAEHDETWLRLLHYGDADPDQGSEILSPEFFLAKNGNTSPRAELEATISAWFEPLGENADSHPRCRFPARYLWLQSTIGLGRDALPVRCGRLEAWAKFEHLDSVSLMMISSYFGNPASTFGHILLKLNNGGADDLGSLLDVGVNYGALVPENELTAVYILRGLSGGYQAGFSDKAFFLHDLTYSRTEFRDMWEYELGLTEYQTRFLLYHLWEIAGKKFTYYFLLQNCSYRLAELLELVSGEDFRSDADWWYAPVSLFHRLREIDQRVDGALIRDIRFVPSAQRILHSSFNVLSPDEQASFNRIVEFGPETTTEALESYTATGRSRVLDVLLLYYQFKLAGEEKGEDAELRKSKDSLILERLKLPPGRPTVDPAIESQRPPSAGSKPSAAGISAGYSEHFGPMAHLSFAAFRYDEIGDNNLGGSSLAVLELDGIASNEDGVALERFDVVRARKLDVDTPDISGESRLSWSLAVGARRENNECFRCVEAFARGALGTAARVGGTWLVYGMFGLDTSSRAEKFELTPGAGLILGAGTRWAGEVAITHRFDMVAKAGETAIDVQSRFTVAQNHDLRIVIESHRGIEGGLSYVFHW